MDLEIPQFSLITDFEAGVRCIENPSLISRFFALSNVVIVRSFWQWVALILAVVATFGGIVKRVKIIHIRRIKSSSESLLHHLDMDLELTDDDSDDDSAASSDDEDEDEPGSPTFFGDEFDDFCVKGSSFWNGGGSLRLRGDFDWPEFTSGKNVVKLWDSLGLSIGFDSFDDCADSEGVVSLWDLDQDKKISDIFAGSVSGHLPAVSASAAPARSVVLAAEMDENRNGVVFGAYDTRMAGRKAAIFAEWGGGAAADGKVVAVAPGGVEKVYVRDAVSGVVTVGDMRMVNSALESDGDMWWDADAVIVDDELVD